MTVTLDSMMLTNVCEWWRVKSCHVLIEFSHSNWVWRLGLVLVRQHQYLCFRSTNEFIYCAWSASWPNQVQSTFSQCIVLVPDFFYALWHFMQGKMCHKVWLSWPLPKMSPFQNHSVMIMRPKLGSTAYLHGIAWERDYYWKKHWEKFVRLNFLDNAACAHLNISVSSGPESWCHFLSMKMDLKSAMFGLKFTNLDKGLHVIYPKWNLPVNMNLLFSPGKVDCVLKSLARYIRGK